MTLKEAKDKVAQSLGYSSWQEVDWYAVDYNYFQEHGHNPPKDHWTDKAAELYKKPNTELLISSDSSRTYVNAFNSNIIPQNTKRQAEDFNDFHILKQEKPIVILPGFNLWLPNHGIYLEIEAKHFTKENLKKWNATVRIWKPELVLENIDDIIANNQSEGTVIYLRKDYPGLGK